MAKTYHLLAMIICMSVCTDMASAWWANICTLGDTYIERNYRDASDCSLCTNWCASQCSTAGGSVVKSPCGHENTWLLCQCCCSKSPAHSPPSPSLPADPSSAPNFTDGTIGDICKVKQPYIPIEHTQASGCPLNPQCANKCEQKGFVSAGSQCMGTSGDGQGQTYTWIEQCCCDIPPPTCTVDTTTYVWKTPGSGCNVTVSVPYLLSPIPGPNQTLIRGNATTVVINKDP
ncbi:hypothetical protein MKW94_008822 [Papaver nudicaule]|uniref:Uncharacterized protein n=1 Tax=Papaver nudicaule TaxID=74823 RepID=A0AA41SIX9_PAPNU|nr:hypothetical protein [Papaver nudicaule]